MYVVDRWVDLADDELRARLSNRLSDETFVGWLVSQRDNVAIVPLVNDVLDDHLG